MPRGYTGPTKERRAARQAQSRADKNLEKRPEGEL